MRSKVGIALRRFAVASYMRRLQYLRCFQQLSIANDAALDVVEPHLRICRIAGEPETDPLEYAGELHLHCSSTA
jgi:hypothetical protein